MDIIIAMSVAMIAIILVSLTFFAAGSALQEQTKKKLREEQFRDKMYEALEQAQGAIVTLKYSVAALERKEQEKKGK